MMNPENRHSDDWSSVGGEIVGERDRFNLIDFEERTKLHFKYLIIGGGNAAGYCCKAFKDAKVPKGSVCVISAEPVPPYERPALSKAYLYPPKTKQPARLPDFYTCVGIGSKKQTIEWYKKNGIELMLSTQATEVLCKTKRVLARNVENNSGRNPVEISYGKLIIATGVKPRVFPGTQSLKNVFNLRTELDAARLVAAMGRTNKPKVLVIGGGFIGVEVAAALSGWDCELTLVYRESHILKSVLTEPIARWIERCFERKGIRLVREVDIQEINEYGSNKSVASLNNGESIYFDIAVVGIGSIPNTDIVQGQVDLAPPEIGGVECDETLRTSDTDVYAVGDVCAFPTVFGSFSRYEHVDHCRASAKQVVDNVIGHEFNDEEEVYEYIPFIYSRMFEYTDEPVIFNFYGSTGKAVKVESDEVIAEEKTEDAVKVINFGSYESDERELCGTLWILGKKIIGGLILNSPKKYAYEKLAQLVRENREIVDTDELSILQLFS